MVAVISGALSDECGKRFRQDFKRWIGREMDFFGNRCCTKKRDTQERYIKKRTKSGVSCNIPFIKVKDNKEQLKERSVQRQKHSFDIAVE